MTESDLAIPFSNFVRSGPRGKGSFTCVGAVTIIARFSGLDELDLELGPIYTNGEEGLEVPLTPIPPTPTSTAIATPSSTSIPSNTEIATIEPSGVPAILAVPDVIATADPKAIRTQTPEVPAQVPQLPTTSASEEQVSTVTAVAAETASPAVKKIKKQPEEAVYGSVVIGD